MLSREDLAGIDAIRAKLVTAILGGDVDAYADSFTEDAVLLHPDTPQIRGTDAIRAYATSVFSAVSVTKLQLTPIVVDGIGGFAFEVGIQQLVIEPSDGKFKSERQHLHVYRKQSDGTWRVAAGMSGNQ